MTCWRELELRFKENQTIDKDAQEELKRENPSERSIVEIICSGETSSSKKLGVSGR